MSLLILVSISIGNPPISYVDSSGGINSIVAPCRS